jgi:hypothetical protein
MIKWPNLDDLSATLPFPAGYRWEQLQRSDIHRLASSFRTWFPDVAIGTESCYHQEDFYHREVSLKGEPETEIIVLVIKADQEFAGMFSVEQSEENLTLYARIGAIAPRHRGAKLTNAGLILLESMGRAMGMALAYFFATLQHPYSQMAAEKTGFQLIGVAPASDRMAIAPGVVKHVYEAIYAKVLAPESDVLRPLAENLTPRTKALFDFLFEQ